MLRWFNIEAFGYKTASFPVKDLDNTIKLTPEILLKALKLRPARGEKVRTISELKPKKRQWHGGENRIGANKITQSFSYQNYYEHTPFVYELKLYKRSLM